MSTISMIQEKMLTVSVQEVLEPKENTVPARIPVLLPDMFVSFLAQTPKVNPLYERVKGESEAWLNESVSHVAMVHST